MRTNIVIDDRLMADAMEASGAATKRETVELALEAFVRLSAQRKILDLKGKVTWVGDLDAMRTD